eukprot:13790169-Ditylum_brightwellii.AAC.1
MLSNRKNVGTPSVMCSNPPLTNIYPAKDNSTLGKQISTKDAGFGANAAVQDTDSAYHNLEEAMKILAYAATTSNNIVEEL